MFAHWFPRGSLRRLVAKNTGSQLIGRVISAISMAVISFMIARYSGPEGYGDFIKMTTYAAFFYTLSDFGLNAVYVQRSTETSLSAARIRWWQLLFGLRLGLAAMLIVFAFVILWFLPDTGERGYTPFVRMGIVLLLPIIATQAATTTANAWFQKLLRYDFSAVAQSAGSLLMLATALFLFVVSPATGSIVGVVSLLAGSAASAVLALYFVRKSGGVTLPLVRWSSMVYDFRRALPLGLTLIFNLIYFHSDSVVLTLTRSTREVGIYGLAYKLFELPLVLPVFFMNAVYPLLLRAKNQRNVLYQSVFFLALSSFGIAVVLWFAPTLFSFIRPDFADSALPLRVLLLGLPIFFVSALFMWVLVAQKKHWVLLTIHAATMIGNIALNVVLIPRFGYMAAAWNTVVSELVVLIISGIVVFRKEK